ncbi:hypothetical protein [Ensifer sp. ENS01]|uniref:hypothetical protein n=1 Tax=Ensifer sp. ENS01 TaxID=2769293 RepID=UPI001784323B|nr:hypothetical protein [Ensifer sp. ENS01]MBD9493183.1 hypothetical protein [Ensifer sp. ENS01]
MTDQPSPDGIYSAYLAGTAGTSFGMFLLKDGVIAGADAGGGSYDGNYTLSPDGGSWTGSISFTLPVGGSTITGQVSTQEPIKIDVPIKLPLNFASSDFVRIETPTGPLNARFVLVRKL